jgi:hypothetical protein
MRLLKSRQMSGLRASSRIVAAATFFAVAELVLGQTHAPAPPPPPMPPPSEALPDTAPPPPAAASDPELEPQVTITKKEGETVEEARVNGKLMWVKVTPRHGKPYYLIPDAIEGTLIRREGFDPGLRVPLWLIFSF